MAYGRGRMIRMAMVAVILCQSAYAFAIGVFFAPKSGGSEVYAPGARAFVHRKGTREDLILQVGFAGTATDFAWVVPVPNRPAVQVADPSIFDELYRIFNPLIIPPKSPDPKPKPAPDQKQPKPVPAQDVMIIAPVEQGALPRWLNDNHYKVSDEAYGILQDYVKRGWYFIVVKVKTTKQPTGARWLQPLWIAFQSERASFPARLTSLNSKPVMTQIYVAADVEVKAPGFTEVYTTGSPLRTKYKLNEFPLFFQIVTRDCQLTELRALLDPKNITSDIVITPK